MGDDQHLGPEGHEAWLRLMIDAVSDYALLMLDTTGRVTSWNVGAQRLKGYSAKEIIGQHFSVFYTADARAAGHPDDELRIALAEGRYEEQGWRVRKDGGRFWANVVITPILDAAGTHVGFAKVTRDFTERRAADETLRQSEERFRLLVDSVHDYAIFSLDVDGRVASWNSGAERIKQYKADEIIGQHFSVFYPEADRARRHPEHELTDAIANGSYGEEGWRVRKDGTEFWASVVITAVRDPVTRALRGFAKVTRDLTERRRMEEEGRRALENIAREHARAEAAQLALQARDEFISVAAHELRTPLTALQLKIDGVMHALRKADLLPHAERLGGALRQVDRLAGLVERLLDVSSIARGRLTLALEEVDLVALAREAVDDFREQARGALGVELSAPDGAVVGTWDKSRIEQVLVNLIANAIKYGERKPVEVRIEALAPSAGTPARARITVVDHGIGIAAEDVSRIFARFERAVPLQNYSGLGLGLYITRSIVDLHGGAIRVVSAVGEGSTFIVELPLRSGAV